MAADNEGYMTFFKAADKNGDGYLSLEELEEILAEHGYNKVKVKAYFKAADISGDGRISMEEYLLAMGQAPINDAKEARMRCVFRDFDTDGNGVIDKDELREVFKSMDAYVDEATLQRMLDEMDTSGDGKIDYEEFIAAVFQEKK